MNNESQQEGNSEYDAEWELDSDDSLDNDEFAETDPKTAEEQTASSESAPESKDDATSKESTENPAEGDTEDDIWANATDAQKEAFRRAENERLAASNRVKTHEDRLAERGRELKTLRDEKSALEQAALTPTEFETEHEEYGKNINEMIERKLTAALPAVEQVEELTNEQVEQQTFDTITEAHPDAGDMYNSDAMQQMLADNPAIVHEGRAFLFSEAIHSSNPNEIVAALSHFKSNQTTPSPAPAAEDSGLSGMQSPNASSTAPDMRTHSQLSTQEQYDSEWDENDI